MQSIPKFVLKRLQERVAPAESHPDADLLTAFAEQSLDKRERALLTEHLSACADCREIVALALPVTESSALPARTAPRFGWLSWPTLRWAALSAGILVVGSAAFLYYSHRGPLTTVASNVMQKGSAPARSVLDQLPPLHATLPSSVARTEPSAASHTVTAHKLPLAHNQRAEHGIDSAGSDGGMVVGSRIASVTGRSVSSKPEATTLASEGSTPSPAPAQNAAPTIRQHVSVGASSTVVEVQAEAGALNTKTATTGQNQIAQNHADLPIQGRSFSDLNVVKAKDPVPSQTAQNAPATPAIGSGMAMQTSSSLTIQASARWTVGPSGTLQRSFDDGNTWQTVDPSASLPGGMARAALNTRPGSEPTDQKNQKKLNDTANAAPNPNPIFRAVAALGPEVWAGASNGVLYHSSDGGNRWTLVTPSEPGAILTGDILSIQFADDQHGRIATSTAELWTTFDAGQTWHKQQ